MLTGYSNFDTILIKNVVNKSAKNMKDFKRLTTEIKKQMLFDTELYGGIKTPKLLSISIINMGYKMKYISDSNLIIMLKKRISKNFVNKLIRYFEINIQNSKHKNILSDFKAKYESTYTNCLNNNSLKTNSYFFHVDFQFRDMLEKLDEMIVPVSYCHGDLTISNMLYKNHTLYFIDFLDNFSDTVLQDMVKIRQDTQFKLIMKMNGMFDENVYDNLDKLDKIFDKLFSKHTFYKEYYVLFQYLSLLRILPYCKKEDVIMYIINAMNRLFTGYRLV